MTDKQIIIDGVDVSECLFYQTNFQEDYDVEIKHYCSNWHNSCESVNNSNCYFKQLKRKEQECNKLYIQLKADEEYYKEEENTLRKIIKNKEERNMELYKENNKLKAENEKLKKDRINMIKENAKGYRKLQQAEQKLEQIKQVIKDYCKIMCLCETKETCESCINTEILQIIDEVE